MTNRLAQAQSLYLRKHAENPIDWWSWCDEALETARRENKPIFLSIGYSSCHWCTVMEGEAFSNLEIAAYLNANFLPIKVDREERPDIDSLYMQALQMMTGQGGWPLNIFLTPEDLVPFYGGTYFPIEPRYGRPGFLQVLQSLRRFYDQEKGKLESLKTDIFNGLQNLALLNPASSLSREALKTGLAYSTSIISGRNPGPSFPMMPYAETALRGTRLPLDSRHDPAESAIARGLDLALGGIFDAVAGGFHRYTVDPTWTVPHFEKMLYDNGQILEYLANLWSFGHHEPAFERSIRLTVEWLQREMTAPEGYFYAAQDADSFVNTSDREPEEGAFYVWTNAELRSRLTSEELQALTDAFTVTETGNFEGANVLQRRSAGVLSPVVEQALQRLFEGRYGEQADRTQPFPPARTNDEAKQQPWPGRIPAVTDPKMIVAWNALMISGLARSAMVFQNLSYLHLATRCAQFILDRQWVNGRLHRLNYDGQAAVLAQAEDYALLIKALLDLQQASLSLDRDRSATWLEAAVRVQAEFDEYLGSPELGGYFNTAKDASQNLLIRERSYLDNATPAANNIAIANLVRLALLREDLTYLDTAERTLQAFGSILQNSPQSCPSLVAALDWFYHPTLVKTGAEQIQTLSQQYWPTMVLQLAEQLPSESIGLVCKALTCLPPATSIEHLQTQIRSVTAAD